MAVATSTALALASIAATTAATGVSIHNTNKTAKRQDSQAAQGIRDQAENQQKVNARLNKTLEETAKSTGADERAKAGDSYIDQIQRSMGRAKQGLTVKNMSEQYDQLAGEAGNDAAAYAGTIGDLMARIDAGGLQRQNEANTFGNMGMDLDVLGKEIQGDQFLNDMAVKRIRRNPYMDFASGALSGAAKSYGSGTRA